MARLRQDGIELGLDSNSSTIEVELIDPELELLEPELPEPELPELPDTRPIWPRRPEMIYSKYLADKNAYLIAHPHIRDYRRARGLEIRSTQQRKYWARFMGLQRLDLETETLVPGRPHWLPEEIDAYADFQALENEREEQVIEVEMASQGGFGTERGIKGVHTRIRHQIQQENAQYRFAP